MKPNITFIVQARLGSTRLPEKIIRPFYKGDSIIEIILKKLSRIQNTQIVLATSINPQNDLLCDIAERTGCRIHRGSENDVLSRFINAAEENNADKIIRVCSDNPFLDISAIKELYTNITESDADYISFDVDGVPSIKTHFGFWTEYVTLDALKRISSLTDESLYHEHVTNYIYTHPDDFKIHWIPTSKAVQGRSDIRLTIDTIGDFTRAAKVFGIINGYTSSIEDIVNYLDQNEREMLLEMKKEIERNNK